THSITFLLLSMYYALEFWVEEYANSTPKHFAIKARKVAVKATKFAVQGRRGVAQSRSEPNVKRGFDLDQLLNVKTFGHWFALFFRGDPHRLATAKMPRRAHLFWLPHL